MSKLQLAEAILAAAKCHEEGYDRAAADAATASAKVSDIIDYAQFQTFTLQEACERAAGEWAQPVYLLLTGTWNDSLDWAKEVVAAGGSKTSMQEFLIAKERTDSQGYIFFNADDSTRKFQEANETVLDFKREGTETGRFKSED